MIITDLSQQAGAFIARKRPIPVTVEFATQAGVLATREGAVQYQMGDALLTGVEGERWPVPRKQFLNTYDAILPTKSGKSGKYIKRPLDIWAWHADAPTDIPLSENRGFLHAEPGDIVVQYAKGNFAVIGRSIFETSYEVQPNID